MKQGKKTHYPFMVLPQGLFGESEMVKWRGTWVVKTVIKPKKSYDETCVDHVL